MQNQNLMLSRDLSKIEDNLIGDIAAQCQEATLDHITAEVIKELQERIKSVTPESWEKCDLRYVLDVATYQMAEMIATAGYMWGIRVGYSAGYTDAVGTLNNPDVTKHQAMTEFRAANRDASFIDQKAADAADVALSPLFKPTRLEVHA